MDSIRSDVRYAIRRLAHSPGFALIAILTLALGIGANAAIFSVVNGVVLRPLPFERPAELVRVYSILRGNRMWAHSGPNFLEMRDQASSLAAVAAYREDETTLTGAGEPQQLGSAYVSAGFFETLGARPVLGRTFGPEENEPGGTDVVVLSHGVWRQEFGADPGLAGRTITVHGRARTVAGVMPAGFDFPAGARLWLPLSYDESFRDDGNRGAFQLNVVGRLAAGATVERADAELAVLGRSIAQRFADNIPDFGLTAASLHEATVGDIRGPLLVLLGAVAFVLLIACANVANLLLARATSRETELAVRAALGAGRGRIARQLLTESLLLALAGGAAGLVIAQWGAEALVALQPENVPRLAEVRLDAATALFTAAAAVLTGLLFGALPAFQLTRSDPGGSLRAGGRGAIGRRGGARARNTLVVAEMALAVVLLAGAGLLINSFGRLAGVDPGFRPEQTATFRLRLPAASYEPGPRVADFYATALERIQGVPGVSSAGAVSALPLAGTWLRTSFDVAGREPAPPGERPTLLVRFATPGYFGTVGIPILRGRGFAELDRAGSAPVALLSADAAERYFPGEEAIGRAVTLGVDLGQGALGGEVVGIVGDVKASEMGEDPQPMVYLAHAQNAWRSMDVVVRSGGDPLELAGAISRAVHGLDANLPVADLRTLEQVVSRSVSQPRFYMLLLGLFAALALVLAAVGVFGVMSYEVAQRRREIGIRMALGAGYGAVLRGVVGQALALALAGLALGLAGALALTRLLEGLLFGVSPTDPPTLLGAALVLVTVAALASFLPARAAARVDPLVALRSE